MGILWSTFIGLGTGFLISLIWFAFELVHLSFSSDQTYGGALPLAFVFIILPTFLLLGGVIGTIIGLIGHFS